MSLRGRLTLWYTAVIAGTLIVFGVLLYYTLAGYIVRETDQALTDTVEQLLQSTEVVKHPFRLREVVLPDVDVFASPDTYLQVVDAKGRVQTRSGNLGPRVLPLSTDTLRLANSSQEGFFETLSTKGSKLRLYNMPLVVGGQFVGIMQVGRSLAQLEQTLSKLRVVLAASVLAAVIIAATVGMMMARTALTPVEEISSTAADIGSGEHLNRRIDYQGPADEVGRLAVTFNDMLARLEQAYKRLEEAYSVQRRFVADASHELRSPLTTIGGNVELLQKMGDSEPTMRKEILADISEETTRMRRLVEDLLALARADAGLQLDKSKIDMAGLLSKVTRVASRRAEDRHFEVDITGAEDISIFANEDYLEQAIIILLDNAFKYTREEGKVKLSIIKDTDKVGVVVSDEGVGIKDDDMPHIFERFYRGDTARKPGGTGLGLAIVRWIVEEHQGDINVKSKWGEGSIFTIWLPVTK